MLFCVKEKANLWLPIALMIVFALTRIPGMLPQNFSAAYALVFCAGVFFAGRLAWWLPLLTLLATDIGLNIYYSHLGVDVWTFSKLIYLFFNYAAYVAIILFGRKFNPRSSFLSLLGGGILGALIFYVITNTASWFFNPFHNPEYTKNISGWLKALITGTKGWPQTWEFFRNTLLSTGIFTGMFVTAMKLTAESPQEKTAGAREEEPESDAEPAEAKS
jgi:hypothetical protein